MKSLPIRVIDDLITRASRASDMPPASLLHLSAVFHDAHARAPGGLSIEVGTRKGGSAWLMLSMLREMYSDTERPMLFTVDPYGGKPYHGGDFTDPQQLYGRNDYRAAKQWLAEFPEHAHFYLTAETFFHNLLGQNYYLRGQELGIEDFTFVLLDGDHSAEAIVTEANYAFARMLKGGAILIDNVDKDPKALPALRDEFPSVSTFPGAPGAMQAVIVR